MDTINSASGANAYIFQCDSTGQQRYYAVCLRLISDQKNSRLESLYPDCFSAIKKKTCPALKMQKQETEAGKSLFWKGRDVAPTLAPAPKLTFTIEPAETIEAAPKPKGDNNIFDKIQNISYADTLNQVINKQVKVEPAPIKNEEAPIVPIGVAKPGESLLDMARRMLAAKSQQ